MANLATLQKGVFHMDTYAWMWLIILVGFILLEALTAQLVSLWFIVGSAVAFFSSLVGLPIVWQVVLFIGVSILSLFIIRPMVKDKIAPRTVPTNADMAIGKIAVVAEDIDNELGKGRATLDGLTWTARSFDGSIIKKGTRVRVYSIDGVKLIVENIKEA